LAVGCARRNSHRRNAQLAREKERLKYERSFALHALYSRNSTPQEESQDGDHPNPNPNSTPPEESQNGDHLRDGHRTSDASGPNDVDDSGASTARHDASDPNDVEDTGASTARPVRAARAPGPDALGVEMVPIDKRSRRQILLSRFKATVRPRGTGPPRDSAPLPTDSAALAIAAGGAAPHSIQSTSAIVRAAGPPEPSRAAAPLWTAASPSRAAASSAMGHLDQFIVRPGIPSNGSSYGTESELETNLPPLSPPMHAEAMATTIPVESPRLPPLLLPQPLHSPPSSTSSTTSSPPTTPPPTPQSLARADALTRTLQAMGLEYKPHTASSPRDRR